MMRISVCIPVYNGANTVGALVEKTRNELSGFDIEFVLVNDGSRDKSDEVCTQLAKERSDVTYICLRRNYGEHNAVMCALNYAAGDYAVIIDDDFQNPPAEIIKLIAEADRGGSDVVYANYTEKKDKVFRNIGSKFNDVVATWLLGKPKNLYLCSFKLISRGCIDEIIKYKGPFPYIDGLILRVTSNISSVLVEHSPRQEGKSNYTLSKLVSLWLNTFVNFSIKPLRMVTFIGLFSAVICVIAGLSFFFEKIVHPDTSPPGWASLSILVLFLGSIQLVGLGLVGEYIGKSYLDVNGTPQWVVKKEILSGNLYPST